MGVITCAMVAKSMEMPSKDRTASLGAPAQRVTIQQSAYRDFLPLWMAGPQDRTMQPLGHGNIYPAVEGLLTCHGPQSCCRVAPLESHPWPLAPIGALAQVISIQWSPHQFHSVLDHPHIPVPNTKD